MPASTDDIINILEDISLDLPAPVKPAVNVQKKSVDIPADADWSADPVGVKWEKICSAFFNAKSAEEVAAEAANMKIGVWLDWAVRMAPKNVKVTGEFNFQHLVADLGPINKDDYLPTKKACRQPSTDAVPEADLSNIIDADFVDITAAGGRSE